MAKNVKRLPRAFDAEVAELVTSRETSLQTMEDNREAYEKFVAAEKVVQKSEKSLLTLMMDAKKQIFHVLGYVLSIVKSIREPKNTVIGIKELMTELKEKGYQKELDLIEDLIEDLKTKKEAANIEEAKSNPIHSLEIAEDKKKALA